MAYAAWAGKRLPTEAEWEYAARGGLVGKKWPWGDCEPTSNDANYDWHVDGTTLVGQYAANGYGLSDMAGNVWEWCLDEDDRDFYAASDGSRNPIAGDVENIQLDAARVVRSSWRSGATYVRVATRSWGMPAATGDFCGFRCARGTVTPCVLTSLT